MLMVERQIHTNKKFTRKISPFTQNNYNKYKLTGHIKSTICNSDTSQLTFLNTIETEKTTL